MSTSGYSKNKSSCYKEKYHKLLWFRSNLFSNKNHIRISILKKTRCWTVQGT